MAESPSPKRDINAVLAAHDRQLLDLPAVVGVYVGVLADGKTPCLKVMLARPTPETERKIPREIEGYPVVTEISGVISPASSLKRSAAQDGILSSGCERETRGRQRFAMADAAVLQCRIFFVAV